MEHLEKYSDTAIELAMIYIPKLLLAILTLIIGLWIISSIVKFMTKLLSEKGADPSLAPFLEGIASIILKLVLFIAVAGMVGIKTTSFVAILGAAGLAVGLALQGSLANFAGSIIILFFKPYKVGDVVDIQDVVGVVDEIKIFTTKITTFDNQVFFIPNGKIANDNIKNITYNDTRRVDFTFNIGYDDDMTKAKTIVREIVESKEKFFKDKDIFVEVTNLGDSSVDISARAWCKREDYWPLYHEVLFQVKETFDREGITIPYPQRDIHVYQEKNLS